MEAKGVCWHEGLLARGFVGAGPGANAVASQQTPSDRGNRPGLSHFREGVSWRRGLITGRQNAESDPPRGRQQTDFRDLSRSSDRGESRLAPDPIIWLDIRLPRSAPIPLRVA